MLEAGSTTLTGIPIATSVDFTSAVYGAPCAVLFFDETNPLDAVIIAMYTNSTNGLPSPQPGRAAFIAGFQLVTAAVITSGSTVTYTPATGVVGQEPTTAIAVVYHAAFSSPTVGAFIQMCPNSGVIGNYAASGNVQVANQTVHTNGILQLDSGGQIQVKAGGGTATFNLFIHGYIT